MYQIIQNVHHSDIMIEEASNSEIEVSENETEDSNDESDDER